VRACVLLMLDWAMGGRGTQQHSTLGSAMTTSAYNMRLASMGRKAHVVPEQMCETSQGEWDAQSQCRYGGQGCAYRPGGSGGVERRVHPPDDIRSSPK
jgi:hypothetical protein